MLLLKNRVATSNETKETEEKPKPETMNVHIAAVRDFINLGFPPDQAQVIVQSQLEREERERERERVHQREINQHELDMARLKSNTKRNGNSSLKIFCSRCYRCDIS